MSLSLGNTPATSGTLRGKGREVRRSLANIFEVEEERGSLERVEEEKEEEIVGVKQLGRLLEKQLSGAERQDGFSYFAGDKPRLEEEGGGGDDMPGPSHRAISKSTPGSSITPAGTRTASPTSHDSDYEDLLRSLTPQPHVSSRRRRRSSASSSGHQSSAVPSSSGIASLSGLQTSELTSVRHSLEGILGQETAESVETVEVVDFYDAYEEENDMFRVSTVSTLSSVSDDEYVFFKAHDEEEEDEEEEEAEGEEEW